MGDWKTPLETLRIGSETLPTLCYRMPQGKPFERHQVMEHFIRHEAELKQHIDIGLYTMLQKDQAHEHHFDELSFGLSLFWSGLKGHPDTPIYYPWDHWAVIFGALREGEPNTTPLIIHSLAVCNV